jgi:hypothetical protein
MRIYGHPQGLFVLRFWFSPIEFQYLVVFFEARCSVDLSQKKVLISIGFNHQINMPSKSTIPS